MKNNENAGEALDLNKLEALAKAARDDIIRSHGWAGTVDGFDALRVDEQYLLAASPVAILELIALARAGIAAPAAPTAYTKQQAHEAWACVRKHNHSIPDDALDGMRDTLYSILAAPAAAQEGKQPELTVWYGPMPESNGKSNFTAVLMRKSEMWDGPHVTIERSEYPDRIRYEADRVRYLIGELSEDPLILDYDAKKHSGYVAAQPKDTTDTRRDA